MGRCGLRDESGGFRRTAGDDAADRSWSVLGTHRPAECSRDHIPSFTQDAASG
jgi:hypothetical protein